MRRAVGVLMLLLCGCAGPGAARPAPTPERAAARLEDLGYFVGTWQASAHNPVTGATFSLRYRVEPTLEGAWFLGTGHAPELGLHLQDYWGVDPQTGELVRVIFDSQGTFGTVRSRGWQDDTLVLEGEARGRKGSIPVRETIRRLGPDAFEAVWEARGEAGWAAYSVERLERLKAE